MRSRTGSAHPIPSGRTGLDTVRVRGLQGTAAFLAALAVAIGAMGAHTFRDLGDLRGAGLMETASQYLMWHALGVLVIGQLHGYFRLPMVVLLGSSMIFSGTLVLLALGAPGWLGAITPIGGTGLIIGWLLVAWTFFRGREAA
jgi:uncharacterized membrane protein YgdD (TMEM256/DUF423 family)